MDTMQLLNEIGLSSLYAIAIIFGGVYGIKYAPKNWEKGHKFLVFGTAVAIIYVAIEIFVQKSFKSSETIKYFVTYLVCGVLYDKFFKALFIKWGLEEKQAEKKDI